MKPSDEDARQAQHDRMTHVHEAGHVVAHLWHEQPFSHVDLSVAEEWQGNVRLGMVDVEPGSGRHDYATYARCSLGGPIAALIGRLDRDEDDDCLAWDDLANDVATQVAERHGDFDSLVTTHIHSLCAFAGWKTAYRASVGQFVGFHVRETTMIVCEQWGHVLAIADRLLERKRLSHAEVTAIVAKAPRRPRAWKRIARQLSWLADPDEPIVTEIWEHVERLRAEESAKSAHPPRGQRRKSRRQPSVRRGGS